MKAHIPFEFTVGNKTFPAGDYSITQPTQRVLAVRDDRGHMIATVFVHDVESRGPMSTLLRFKLVDGQYSLAEVWSQDGSSTGQQLAQAKPAPSTCPEPLGRYGPRQRRQPVILALKMLC